MICQSALADELLLAENQQSDSPSMVSTPSALRSAQAQPHGIIWRESGRG